MALLLVASGCGGGSGGSSDGDAADAPASIDELGGDPDVAVITENRVLLKAGAFAGDGKSRLWTVTGAGEVFQLEPPVEAPIVPGTDDTQPTITQALFTEGSLWFNDVGMLAGGSLTRVDPDAKKVVGTISFPAPYGPALIAAGPGTIWSTGAIPPEMKTVIFRTDIASGGVERIGSSDLVSSAIVTLGDQVWTTRSSPEQLRQLDAAGNETATVPMPDFTTALWAADGQVWAAMQGSTTKGALIRVDPESHTVTGHVDLPGQAATVAFADGSLWAVVVPAGELDTSAPTTTIAEGAVRTVPLLRIDPKSLEVTGSIDVPAGGNLDLQVLGDNLWLLIGRSGDLPARLLEIKPA